MPSPIEYADGVLRIVDQTKLPDAVEVIEMRSWNAVPDAIATMKVRGAPAIGITGAYGMALAAQQYGRASAGRASATATAATADFLAELEVAAAALASARPTAVNLAWAVNAILDEARTLAAAGGTPASIAARLQERAREIHDDDIETCRRIGDAGAALMPDGCSILTHCNTGDFATGGYGTALGIIRSAWRDGKLLRVFVDETRPMLQGARLTVWELQQDRIPNILIADAMAGYFMGRGEITAVVVGADRIARNGDVANKIGTYPLAVLAKEHNIPFIVAAPRSSFDPELASGSGVIIEERDRREVTEIRGVAIAPKETIAANPAFDVTPARFVSAIVTEFGILKPPFEPAIAAMLERSAAQARPLLDPRRPAAAP